MASLKFIKKNSGFVCRQCGARVPPHPSSSRDHCNKCLFSLHVDIFPGDRENPCKGFLEPIGITTKKAKQQIVYRCLKCRKKIVNLFAPDDNEEKIIDLSCHFEPDSGY